MIPPEEWRWTGRRDRFAGYTHGSLREPNQGEFDAWVAKFDAHGRLQWKRQLETVFDDAAQGSDGERQRRCRHVRNPPRRRRRFVAKCRAVWSHLGFVARCHVGRGIRGREDRSR